MQVGDIEIVPVRDGSVAMPPSLMFTASARDWEPHRQFLDADGLVPMEVGGFLLRGAGDHVALVDLGLGPLGTNLGMGRFLESLATLGLAPDDITDVLLTHLHIDHIGWAAIDGAATFPNAVYRCSSLDWSYFVEPGGAAPAPLAAMIGAPSEAEMIGPVADRIELWEEGTLMPGVDLMMAPGHTPGSTVIVISSGTERAVLLGDVVHCPVELVDPDWEVLNDVDPELARRTREAVVDEYEGTDVPLVAAHFAEMRFGRLLAGQGRRQWVLE